MDLFPICSKESPSFPSANRSVSPVHAEVLRIINESNECTVFVLREPLLTPKEHVDMQIVQEVQRLNREAREQDRADSERRHKETLDLQKELQNKFEERIQAQYDERQCALNERQKKIDAAADVAAKLSQDKDEKERKWKQAVERGVNRRFWITIAVTLIASIILNAPLWLKRWQESRVVPQISGSTSVPLPAGPIPVSPSSEPSPDPVLLPNDEPSHSQ
jgi:hypothetical protein